MALEDLALFGYDICSWFLMASSAVETVDGLMYGHLPVLTNVVIGLLEVVMLVFMWKIYRYFRKQIVKL